MSALFHGLVKETFVVVYHLYFSGLVQELNAYCRKPWHKWQATLKQDYFNNPWAIVSIIPDAIQAGCSILLPNCFSFCFKLLWVEQYAKYYLVSAVSVLLSMSHFV
jgi:hypothetical protein